MKDLELLELLGYEDVIVYSNSSYDGALIDVTLDNQAVYDYQKMVEYLIETEKMDEEEVVDFINYNYSFNPRNDFPIIMININDWEGE